jgi:hypothetical protein
VHRLVFRGRIIFVGLNVSVMHKAGKKFLGVPGCIFVGIGIVRVMVVVVIGRGG